MRLPAIRNPIRLTAVICVGVIAGYVMWVGYLLVQILASPGWCGKALQAEKISSQNFGGLTACTDLLKIQLTALSRANLVYAGVIALCLLVLVVIVLAGAHLELKASQAGVDLKMGKGATPVTVVNPPSEPVPVHPSPEAPPTGPTMPEVKS